MATRKFQSHYKYMEIGKSGNRVLFTKRLLLYFLLENYTFLWQIMKIQIILVHKTCTSTITTPGVKVVNLLSKTSLRNHAFFRKISFLNLFMKYYNFLWQIMKIEVILVH